MSITKDQWLAGVDGRQSDPVNRPLPALIIGRFEDDFADSLRERGFSVWVSPSKRRLVVSYDDASLRWYLDELQLGG